MRAITDAGVKLEIATDYVSDASIENHYGPAAALLGSSQPDVHERVELFCR
jgi:hypothetical protein